jgi:hypothetical protein
VSVAGAEARGAAFANERFYSMFDTETGQTVKVKGKAINNDTNSRYLDPSDPNVKAEGGALAANEKYYSATNRFLNKIDENIKTITRLKDVFAKNGRPLNLLTNQARNFLGDGDWKALQLAIYSTEQEVTKVEGGSLGNAEASVTAQDIVKKLHDKNLPFSEFIKIMNMARELGDNARRGNQKEKQRIQSELRGMSGGQSKDKDVPTLTISPKTTKSEIRASIRKASGPDVTDAAIEEYINKTYSKQPGK